MRRLNYFLLLIFVLFSFSNQEIYGSSEEVPKKVTISKAVLQDKIKGGWAGQTIGCTYGSPTEFNFRGTMIQDYIPIHWPDGNIKEHFDKGYGPYDDVYMDLTFVEVFERLGLDAPADSIAVAFATASYPLWHANQAARYNILNGIMPPESGHWLNNPHADDLDYQIEADYAGLMTPGMPNAASEISDKVGHIMCYGDGWYGGVYVGAMYSLAFVSDDIKFIVTEALKTIPKESKFYQCMTDVIKWHEKYPNDWKQTWFECERKWSEEIGCPEGVLDSYSIDAIINSAYIIVGLLYGEGDFFKTIDISTRCGQDSDCNPASAAGILATMTGYSKIPTYWKKNLEEVEDRNFSHTSTSINKATQLSLKHALEMITRNGGKVKGDEVTIACQKPKAVKLEQSFEGMYPVRKEALVNNNIKTLTFEFEGTGFVLRGGAHKQNNSYPETELIATMYIDGEKVETAKFPTDFKTRRIDLFWKYQLPKGKHTVKIELETPSDKYTLRSREYIVYSDTPAITSHPQ